MLHSINQGGRDHSNRVLPGVIANHLTSSGGQLTDNRQMSSLIWLKAGATGSQGAVVEPCVCTQKFTRPDIVVDRYLNHERCWRLAASVSPGRGRGDIGEPLAASFREKNTSRQKGEPDSPGSKNRD